MNTDFSSTLKLRNFWFLVIIVVSVCLFPRKGNAQMFSVNNHKPAYRQPQSGFFVGWEPMDVTYKGGDDAGKTNNLGLFAFNGSILRLGIQTNTLNLSLGTGGQLTGLNDVSYFDIGGNLNFSAPLFYKKHKFRLMLPVRISARFTNMSNTNRTSGAYNNFRIGGITVGAGLKMSAYLAHNVRLSIGGIPSYGFSFSSGGLFGGSLGMVEAPARIYFDHLLGELGLSLGYEYRLRYYDIDQDVYDYRMSANSIQLGITF